jgi:hypothetical protein
MMNELIEGYEIEEVTDPTKLFDYLSKASGFWAKENVVWFENAKL